MSEIVGIHIGGFGTRIGVNFWQKLKKEHQTDNTQNNEDSNLNVFFNQKQKTNELIPRCILIDSDPRVNAYRGLLPLQSSSIISAQSSCRNLFPEGKYKMGGDIMEQVMERVRKEIERCDRLSGFMLTHSFGGGCGSGITALCLENLSENYRYHIVENFGLFPEYQKSPSNPLQIYNTVLSLHNHIQYTNLDVVMQNRALQDYVFSKQTNHPSQKDVNNRIVEGMLEHTAPYRYSGPLNTNQRKRLVNMVMFPRLKMAIPVISQPHQKNYVESSFDIINRFMKIDNFHRIYASIITVRDPLAYQSQIDQTVKKMITKHGTQTEWLPCPYGISITGKVDNKRGPSAWNLVNSSSISDPIKAFGQLFTAQFRRKAYLYHYCGLGMDEMQFTQAQSNCNDLISEYVPCSCCYVDDEQYDEEEEG